MATAATFSPGATPANHQIFNMSQKATKISAKPGEYLEDASSAFEEKLYKTAAKYYKKALDNWINDDNNNKRQNQIFVLIRYMLCLCLLESDDSKDLLDSLNKLEDLMMSTNENHEYPMLYYALGKAYFKLYRFEKADDIINKGFAVINGDINLIEYTRPGTSIVISESKKERLLAKLVKLRKLCSGWRRPDASCCLVDCSNYCHNEGVDKNIFFGSPTFHGMIQVTCNNPSNFCTMHFHLACWKAKKEKLCSLGKLSDKDVLNRECFTPNCENQGLRCVIKKIEIYDETGYIKASVEPRIDDATWHAKVNQPVKGAVKKQQQMFRIKVSSNDTRGVPYERTPPRSQSIPNDVTMHNVATLHRVKNDDTGEDEDLHDEQALKASIEKLVELRERNFDIPVDEVWRPDLQMYGNEYMLSTAEQYPDPDFGNGDEAITKGFLFSYFYSYISENGPVKLEDLAIKWEEAKTLSDYSHSILNHHIDITEFLLQSLKFALVGDYICVAGKLPDAYETTKNVVCSVLKFFMENDVDQHSSSSSVDDETLTNDLMNDEKLLNNNPFSYYSTFDEKPLTEESTIISEIEIKDFEMINKSDSSIKNLTETVYLPQNEISKDDNIEKFATNNEINTSEVFVTSASVDNNISITPNLLSPTKSLKNYSPIAKHVEKRARTLKYPDNESTNQLLSTLNVEKNIENNYESFFNSTNLTGYPLYKIEKNLFSQSNNYNENATSTINGKLQFNFGEKIFPKEFKSTNDSVNNSAPISDDNTTLMNNSNDSGNRTIQTNRRHFLSSPTSVNDAQNNCNNWDSSRMEKFKENPIVPELINEVKENPIVPELINEVKELCQELATNKDKTVKLEFELEQLNKAHVAMRMRMLQKILHGQYAYDHSLITTKIEECQKNIDVFASIKTILMDSIGHNLPDFGDEWLKVKTKLEEISKNHETKFWRLNNELYSSTSTTNLSTDIDLKLEKMPNMPETELITVIKAAFGLYRMHKMKEFQKFQIPQTVTSLQPPNMCGTQSMYGGNPSSGYGNNQNSYFSNDSNVFNYHPYQSQTNLQNIGIPPPLIRLNNPQPTPYIPSIPFYPPQFSPLYHQNYMQQPNLASYQKSINNHSIQQNQQINNSSHTTTQQKISTIDYKTTLLETSSSSLLSNNNLSIFDKLNFQITSNINETKNLPSITARSSPILSSIDDTIPPKRPNSVAEIENYRKTEIITKDKNFRDNKYFSNNVINQDIPKTSEQKNFTNFINIQTSDSKRSNSVPELPKLYNEEKFIDTQSKLMTEMEKLKMTIKDDDVTNVTDNGKSRNCWNTIVSQTKKKNYDVETKNTIFGIQINNTVEMEMNDKKMTKNTKSMDKLIRKMRNIYKGVLELDLIKAIEGVRKNHDNSLTGMNIARIVHEADYYIIERQQKQLCGYNVPLTNQYYTVNTSNSTNPWNSLEHEKNSQISASTSFADSMKKEPQRSLISKKTWEPVTEPNETWTRETPESTCCICLESVLDKEFGESCALKCKHVFHVKCIEQWNVRNPTCPECRLYCPNETSYPALGV